jgi:hypothetical protein
MSTACHAVGAQALHLALLQHAQQLGLQAGGHGLDLVQEQRALVGKLDAPHAGAAWHRESATLVPEEFTFHQGLGQRGTVDGHERPAAGR